METKNIDQSDLKSIIKTTANQFEKGMGLAKDVRVENKFKSLTISGMGGSALPADLLDTFLRQDSQNFKIFANRFYSLPQEAAENSLNIISSYSGNTEETVSSFSEALGENLDLIGISAGGKIEEICKENNVTHIKLPGGIQPRMATGYFFGAIYKVLANSGLIEDKSDEILKLAQRLAEEQDSLEEKGKEIAKMLANKTPVIYTSDRFKYIARNWKIKINENSKTPAFWNFFPELNHNELVGFTNPKADYFMVMLRDPNDHEQSKKRFEVTAKLLEEKEISSTIIDIPNEHAFFQMFWSLSLGEWTSYYLALQYGQDPTPVDMVEDFKKML